jgi:hypothetical protein
MRGHIRLRGKTWYAVLSTKDEFGRRKTIWRSLPDATGKRSVQAQCNELLREMKQGRFVTAKATTLAEWVQHWLSIGAPGKRKQRVGAKCLERYSQLLRCHVLPTLGHRRLQDIRGTDIDTIYNNLGSKLSDATFGVASHRIAVVLAGGKEDHSDASY